MPVTAKLSRKFYEKLGDDIATELVEWFNQVDASYRSDLRDFNDANFARFDAKLEQRLAEMGAVTSTALSRFDAKLEQRLAEMGAGTHSALAETRADMTAGFARADARLEQGLAAVRAELAAGFARADAKLEQRLAETKADLRHEIGIARADLLKWMFRYWLGSVAANAALIVTVVALLRR